MLTLNKAQSIIAKSAGPSSSRKRTIGVAYTPVVNGQPGSETSVMMPVDSFNHATMILACPDDADSLLVSAIVLMSQDTADEQPETRQIEVFRVSGATMYLNNVMHGVYESLGFASVVNGARVLLDFTGAAPSDVVGSLMAYALPPAEPSIAPIYN